MEGLPEYDEYDEYDELEEVNIKVNVNYNNEEINMGQTTNLKSFNYLENGEVLYSPLESIKTEKQLDKGIYTIKWLDNPENRVGVFKQNEKEDVKIYEFDAKKQIDLLFETFFSDKVRTTINQKGFLHKIGLLLYGKEGTGKTTILKYYYNKSIENEDAIVFYIDEIHSQRIDLCWEFIEKIRKVQDNPIIVIFEECDEMITTGLSESSLKMILDGNKSIDNCIFLATTNYIDKIPDALKKRKSRFKYSLEISGIKDVSVVKSILTHMLSDIHTKEEIELLSKDLLGSTLDDIKQYCIDKIMNINSYNPKVNKIGF